MVRDLWRKGFTKKVSSELLSLEWKSEGVMDGESGEEKDGLR